MTQVFSEAPRKSSATSTYTVTANGTYIAVAVGSSANSTYSASIPSTTGQILGSASGSSGAYSAFAMAVINASSGDTITLTSGGGSWGGETHTIFKLDKTLSSCNTSFVTCLGGGGIHTATQGTASQVAVQVCDNTYIDKYFFVVAGVSSRGEPNVNDASVFLNCGNSIFDIYDTGASSISNFFKYALSKSILIPTFSANWTGSWSHGYISLFVVELDF